MSENPETQVSPEDQVHSLLEAMQVKAVQYIAQGKTAMEAMILVLDEAQHSLLQGLFNKPKAKSEQPKEEQSQ